jgi:hypothetical protein
MIDGTLIPFANFIENKINICSFSGTKFFKQIDCYNVAILNMDHLLNLQTRNRKEGTLTGLNYQYENII